MCNFSITLILKAIMTKRVHFFCRTKNFNKNETESEMENATHVFRETNLMLQHLKVL